jgi:hypothetical protein
MTVGGRSLQRARVDGVEGDGDLNELRQRAIELEHHACSRGDTEATAARVIEELADFDGLCQAMTCTSPSASEQWRRWRSLQPSPPLRRSRRSSSRPQRPCR